ncbi:YbjN domain-containing protein [Pseudactinotalea sp.]|uniref:YbjN domain-containing protein n=1 Tax=Pseudactinotalea sp. TaxID=1926260 RepID=UPI003B3AB094
MTSPSDLPSAPDIPAPVTLARVAALLRPDGWAVDTEKASVRHRWPHLEVAVTVRESEGMLLLVRGAHVGEPIPLDRASAVEAFVNDWHRDRIWPVIVHTSTDDAIVVHTHVGVDATAGLTATQLDDYLRIGLGTTHQCFRALAEVGIVPRVDPQGSADPDAG